MIEIIVALITGAATVAAALITRPDAAPKVVRRVETVVGGGATIASGSPRIEWSPGSLRLILVLFLVGAVAGGLVAGVVKEATAQRLDEGGFRVPSGTIVAYMGNSAPDGWLLCDGSEIEKGHRELRRIVGDRTPDLRGKFLRGLDSTGSVDPDGQARKIGSPQGDQLKKHSHLYWKAYHNEGAGGKSGAGVPVVYASSMAVDTDANLDGGTETRPKNTAVNFIIKY